MANPKMVVTLEVDDKGSVKIKKFGGALEEVGTKGSGFGSKMMAAGKGVAHIAGQAVLAAGKVAALGAALAAAAGAFVVKKSLADFMEFETALVDMGKVTGESFDSIRARIRELPAELGTATELVKGYYQVMSAGVTEPAKAIELLTEASKMAKASHMEQSEVIKGLTKVMAGYEGEIRSVAEAADLLYAIEKEGQTSVQELIPVIGGLAKMSKDLGVSTRELGGSLAQISQTAGSTAEAATQYQSVLTALMKPTTEMKNALAAMGYESAQAAIKSLGFVETLRQLKEQTGGSAEKMAALFGRVEGLKGVSALAANEFANLTAKVGAMGEAAGSAGAAWERYRGTLQAIWDTFKDVVTNQLIWIGEKLAPAVKDIVDRLGKWLEVNRDLIASEVAKWIGYVEQALRALWPVVEGVALKIYAWYQANSELVSQNLPGHIENIVTAFRGMAESGALIISVLADIVKGVVWLTDKLAWAASAVVDFYDMVTGKLRDISAFIASNTPEFIIKFLGRGSSELPISEKLAEVDAGMQGLASSISALEPKLTVDVSSATGAMRSLDSDWRGVAADIEGRAVSPQLDTSGLEGAFDGISSDWQAICAEIESRPLVPQVNTGPAMQSLAGIQASYEQIRSAVWPDIEDGTLSVIDSVSQTAQSAAKDVANTCKDCIGAVATWNKTKIAETNLVAQQVAQKLNDQPASLSNSTVNASGPGGGPVKVKTLYWWWRSGRWEEGPTQDMKDADFNTKAYASGTGLSGLPNTGMFQGHAGEIVLNPSQSQALRALTGSSGGMGGSQAFNMKKEAYSGPAGVARPLPEAIAQGLASMMNAYHGGSAGGISQAFGPGISHVPYSGPAGVARPLPEAIMSNMPANGPGHGQGQGAAFSGSGVSITFSPMFMTGDRQAMRTAGMELKKILDEIEHRWK